MPVNIRIGKRRKSDTPPRYDHDLPSFLENSPYFLPPSEEVESRHDKYRSRPRLNLTQMLKSRRIRGSVLGVVIFIALVVVYLRSRPSESISMNLGRLGLLPWGGARCLYDASRQATVPLQTEVGAAIDWSANAYATYVTSPEYLCNAVMIFESLARLESKAARVLLYPNTDQFSPSSDGLGIAENLRLLVKARDEYGVNLVPVEIWHKSFNYALWQDSYTKLLAFNQTRYKRILFLDSDATVQSPMDELFLLPPCPAAMPRAYWLQKPILTSHIMLIQPSALEFARVEKAVRKAGQGTYDMEIMNNLYGNDCVVLPHQRYALLTGELRKENHEGYLGIGSGGEWDPEKTFSKAKFVHFSDYPMPKPWEYITREDVEQNQPPCDKGGDCRAREVWLGLYRDFRDRRMSICELVTP